jgi:hypothetical protein
MCLPNVLMSATQILEFVKAADCHPNFAIVFGIILTMSMTRPKKKNYVDDCCICRKKFFEIQIIEKVLEIVNVTRKVEWFSHFI